MDQPPAGLQHSTIVLVQCPTCKPNRSACRASTSPPSSPTLACNIAHTKIRQTAKRRAIASKATQQYRVHAKTTIYPYRMHHAKTLTSSSHTKQSKEQATATQAARTLLSPTEPISVPDAPHACTPIDQPRSYRQKARINSAGATPYLQRRPLILDGLHLPAKLAHSRLQNGSPAHHKRNSPKSKQQQTKPPEPFYPSKSRYPYHMHPKEAQQWTSHRPVYSTQP